jgi:hypothetical protein
VTWLWLWLLCSGCFGLGYVARALMENMDMTTTKCRTCGAPIIWLKTANGKAMPVNANAVEEGDTVFIPKRHKSHFSTCPQAAEWRKTKSQPPPGP